jgi:flagellar biosynthesis anti-sigma factor FlgM
MAINGIATNPVSPKIMQEVQRTNLPSDNSPKPAAAYDARRGDTVYISEQSREFMKVRQLVDQLPDVRIDRVNRLADKIEKGDYKVSGINLADAVVRKNMVDIRV